VLALGAGIAILGAWLFAAQMINAPYYRGLDPNLGCAWLAAIFAVFATLALIDAL
jgi:hypothetical protein